MYGYNGWNKPKQNGLKIQLEIVTPDDTFKTENVLEGIKYISANELKYLTAGIIELVNQYLVRDRLLDLNTSIISLRKDRLPEQLKLNEPKQDPDSSGLSDIDYLD